ncbi:MAG: hypothetical protein G01um101416_699 [Microgenomates group bacterium Gr01-1014_16]|nr:MAG: hypothetical protein G01um101416_699 [Microgenomates group bacterium Gr01-1014_16]
MTIPNMGRVQLAQLFAELEFIKGAEIGVLEGGYSEVLCQANPKFRLFSIDPWKASAFEPDQTGIYSQPQFDAFFKIAKKRLSKYNCQIIKKESLKAAADFADESLDFVYIDGNHDFINVANDLHTWQKKVKAGGIVSGHDYFNFPSYHRNHVKRVLLAYTLSYGIKPLFIVGADAVRQRGVIRDHFRSWFWVKT